MSSVMFGAPQDWPSQDLIGYSEEFGEQQVLTGYAAGVFPMPLAPESPMGWWSPMWRGIFPVGRLRVTRSLRKMVRRYTTTTDQAFDEVLARCAAPDRPDGWIDERIAAVYRRLHQQGVVHSVEVWDAQRRLVGGLYGVRLRGLFAGESMFHDAELGRDASKVALLRLQLELLACQVVLLDTQWLTGHLASLGAMQVSRQRYLELLGEALSQLGHPWPGPRELSGNRLLALWDEATPHA